MECGISCSKLMTELSIAKGVFNTDCQYNIQKLVEYLVIVRHCAIKLSTLTIHVKHPHVSMPSFQNLPKLMNWERFAPLHKHWYYYCWFHHPLHHTPLIFDYVKEKGRREMIQIMYDLTTTCHRPFFTALLQTLRTC